MRIKEISFEGLFKIFNHTIPLNLDDRITIIHGPNGYGKTTILKLLDIVFAGGNPENLIEILSQGLGKAIGSERQHQDITAEKLEKSLRLAYEITEFKKTSLYKSIKDWESRNSPYRVLVENS